MNTPVNILLVDDEVRNLNALETILESPDYRLVRAQSADEALRALITDSFAVVVLDVRLPDMNGVELAHLLKQRKKTQHLPDRKSTRLNSSHGYISYAVFCLK